MELTCAFQYDMKKIYYVWIVIDESSTTVFYLIQHLSVPMLNVNEKKWNS